MSASRNQRQDCRRSRISHNQHSARHPAGSQLDGGIEKVPMDDCKCPERPADFRYSAPPKCKKASPKASPRAPGATGMGQPWPPRNRGTCAQTGPEATSGLSACPATPYAAFVAEQTAAGQSLGVAATGTKPASRSRKSSARNRATRFRSVIPPVLSNRFSEVSAMRLLRAGINQK